MGPWRGCPTAQRQPVSNPTPPQCPKRTSPVSPQDNQVLWLAGLCRQVEATGSAQGPAYPWCGWGPLQPPAQECWWLWNFYRSCPQTTVIHNHQQIHVPFLYFPLPPEPGSPRNWTQLVAHHPQCNQSLSGPQTCSLFPAKISWPTKWKEERPAGECYSLIPGITWVWEHLYIVARLHHIMANKRVDEGALHHVCGREREARLSTQGPGLWAAVAGC